MKFVVIFEDASTANPDIRSKFMQQHLSFLDENKVEAAGPLTDPEDKGRDGLWIVEAEHPDDVEKLVRNDPFWPTGLRQSYTILPWKQVYAAGKKLI